MVENKLVCPYCSSRNTEIMGVCVFYPKMLVHRCLSCKMRFNSNTKLNRKMNFSEKPLKHYPLIKSLFGEGD